MSNPFWTRRRLLATSLAATGAAVLARPRVALGAATADAPRWIELLNTPPGESLSLAWHAGRALAPGALSDLGHLLRDHRANEQHAIDPGLYEQMTAVALAAGRDARFEVISGYRSSGTNARLAAASAGVARRSLHMDGRAIDVRLKGATCTRVRDIALALACGGVGFYRKSDFVHLDTGRVRSWQG